MGRTTPKGAFTKAFAQSNPSLLQKKADSKVQQPPPLSHRHQQPVVPPQVTTSSQTHLRMASACRVGHKGTRHQGKQSRPGFHEIPGISSFPVVSEILISRPKLIF
jgi:hypothetical protein